VDRVRNQKVAALLILVCAFFGALSHFYNPLIDPDFWWHLKLGQMILASNHLPQIDQFSFAPQTLAFVDHSWLSEIFLAFFYQKGAENGLLIGRFLLLFAGSSLILWAVHSRLNNLFLSILVYLLFLPLLAIYISLRPQAFSLILLLCLLKILSKQTVQPLLVSFLFLLWANLHAGVTLGVIFYLIWLAGSYSKLTDKSFFRIALLFSPLLALLLTPYGTQLLSYFWRQTFSYKGHIVEWQPLSAELFLYWLCFGLSPLLGVLLTKGVKKRGAELTFFAFLLLISVLHRRFLIFLELVGVCVWADLIGALLFKFKSNIFEKREALLSYFGTVAVIIFSIVSLEYSSHDFSLEGISKRDYPYGALTFLRQASGEELKVAAPLHWGGYLAYAAWPKVKVSLDGRNDMVYAADYVKSALEAYYSGDLEHFSYANGVQADYLLTESKNEVINRAISQDGKWQLVYKDNLSLLYKR